MAAGLPSGWIAPLSDSGKNGLVVADWLGWAATVEAPLCRDDDRSLHMPGGTDDKSDLGFTRELVV